MAPLRIVVVGGGIGGMAAAAGLARNGHEVTVFERAESSGGVGFAFRITQNSDRCLRHLGIDTVAGGACVSNGVKLHKATGELLRFAKENTEKGSQGESSVFAYRPQLHQQLWDTATQNGARVVAGAKVKEIDVEHTTVFTEDGEKVEADLIIGADGLYSVVRRYVVDSTKFYHKPSAGSNCLRFMIPTETLRRDDLLGPMYEESQFNLAWTNLGKIILAYPVDYGKQVNLTCTHPAELSNRETETIDAGTAIDYNHKISAEKALELYSEFEPRVRRFLELADPNGFRIWQLMDLDEIPHWSLNGTVLLGDCCHAVLPFSYSGASMAIEDASVLTEFLPRDIMKKDLTDRLRLYEKVRRPRIDRIREFARNTALGPMNADDQDQYREWLTSFHVIEDAREKLAAQ